MIVSNRYVLMNTLFNTSLKTARRRAWLNQFLWKENKVVKDIFTGLLCTMKRCELFHNFQEYCNHILCKYRLLSKMYQFNKSSWWIPFSLHSQLCAIFFWPWVLYYPISFCERLHIHLSFHNSELWHVVSWNQSRFSVFRSPPLFCEAISFFDLELSKPTTP